MKLLTTFRRWRARRRLEKHLAQVRYVREYLRKPPHHSASRNGVASL